MAGNPLVAGVQDTTTPFAGAGLIDDGASLVSAIQSGNWVQGGIAAFSEGMDIAAAVSDPIGTLIANGLGWLIDHFEPLKGWFDDLTGDHDEVTAFATTWSNIGQALHGSSTELTRILADLDDLHGQTIDAYRRFQTDSADHLHAAGDWAAAISTGLTVASTIVGLVHDLVRDAISQLVGSAISWAAEEVFSLGLATPWVVEQVSTRCASLAEKIGTKIPALIKAVHTLSELLDKLKTLFSKGNALLSKLLHGGGGRSVERAGADAAGGAAHAGDDAAQELADLQALRDYTGPSYRTMNEALRDPSKMTPELQEQIDAATRALDRMPDHAGTVYRGESTDLSADYLKEYQPGATVTHDAFTSTSHGSPFGGNVQYVIESVHGKSVEHISQYVSEKEILFRPHSTFTVTSRTETPDRIVITMSENG